MKNIYDDENNNGFINDCFLLHNIKYRYTNWNFIIYIYITNKSVALYKSISISKYFTTSSIFKLRNVGFPFLKYQILLIIQNANNMKISVNQDIITKV